jgi:hypothetical protein
MNTANPVFSWIIIVDIGVYFICDMQWPLGVQEHHPEVLRFHELQGQHLDTNSLQISELANEYRAKLYQD